MGHRDTAYPLEGASRQLKPVPDHPDAKMALLDPRLTVDFQTFAGNHDVR